MPAIIQRNFHFLVLMACGVSALPGSAAQPYATTTIVGWGINMPREVLRLDSTDPVVGIAAPGSTQGLALRADGTVAEWAIDVKGNVQFITNSPGLTQVAGIAGGAWCELALKQDGTVAAWGESFFGQTNVPSGLSNVVSMAAGKYHCLALKRDGTVAAWGDGYFGETKVPSGLRDVIAVSAGWGYSLALKQDGTVVAWGTFRQVLGLAATPPAGLSNVVAISAGAEHALALRADRTVVAWGYAYLGSNSYAPASVPGGLRDVVAVAAGFRSSLALKADGTVVSWADPFLAAEPVPSGLSNVVAIAQGGYHSLALVYPGPHVPEIRYAPISQTAESGSTLRLSVTADGAPPLSYQWVLNETNSVQRGLSPTLELAHLQADQAGTYRVIITNGYGCVTSSPARLSVIPQVPRVTIPVLQIVDDVGSQVHISRSDTLGSGALWQELNTVRMAASRQIYVDTSDPLAPAGFYRAWQTNAPSAKPELQVGMATKIALTGALGTQIRVDYINQYGPIDAWVTLDTVTLTNTAQSYLDLSMFGQPARLYRLVPASP